MKTTAGPVRWFSGVNGLTPKPSDLSAGNCNHVTKYERGPSLESLKIIQSETAMLHDKGHNVQQTTPWVEGGSRIILFRQNCGTLEGHGLKYRIVIRNKTNMNQL